MISSIGNASLGDRDDLLGHDYRVAGLDIIPDVLVENVLQHVVLGDDVGLYGVSRVPAVIGVYFKILALVGLKWHFHCVSPISPDITGSNQPTPYTFLYSFIFSTYSLPGITSFSSASMMSLMFTMEYTLTPNSS